MVRCVYWYLSVDCVAVFRRSATWFHDSYYSRYCPGLPDRTCCPTYISLSSPSHYVMMFFVMFIFQRCLGGCGCSSLDKVFEGQKCLRYEILIISKLMDHLNRMTDNLFIGSSFGTFLSNSGFFRSEKYETSRLECVSTIFPWCGWLWIKVLYRNQLWFDAIFEFAFGRKIRRDKK